MRRLLLLPALLLLPIAAGCGSSGDDAAPAGPAAADRGAFPVTVEHRFGKTTITERPKRVAVVGFTEQDVLLALGIKPVLTTDWYGGQPSAVWPWARSRLGAAKPIVLKAGDGIDLEGVAKARPDLIVGTNVGIKKGVYEKLSAIAPTIPGCKGELEYYCPWDKQTALVSKAVGRADDGAKLVADVKRRFADVAAEHPELQDKVVTFTQNAFYDNKLYAYPPGLNTQFLTMLGLTVNPRLTALAEPGIQAGISAERLDVLDTDLMVVAAEKPADVANLMKIPTFRPLDVVAKHRTVFTDPVLSGAMYFMTPLSLRYVADHLTPLLDAATDGRAPHRIAATA